MRQSIACAGGVWPEATAASRSAAQRTFDALGKLSHVKTVVTGRHCPAAGAHNARRNSGADEAILLAAVVFPAPGAAPPP